MSELVDIPVHTPTSSMTTAQQAAVAARGNVLVVAGAGTGKTRTLVERCLNCLLEERQRASLEEILMVTFTEAAAAEMRQRIRARLEQEMARRPEESHWPEQLALFETAHIGTLHSFCFQLVRQHFYELDLDPQLTVLAEEEARLLAEETLDGVLQKHYAGRDRAADAVRQLIQTQGRGWDKPIRTLTMKIHHYTQTLPDPAGWMRRQAAMFAADAPAMWEPWLLQGVADWRARWLPALEREAIGNDLAAKCAAALRALPQQPNCLEAAAGLEAISSAASDCPRGTRTESFKPLQAFLDEAGFLLSLTSAGGDPDPLAEDWSWTHGQMAALLELAKEFTQAFSEAKRELGMVDFHDLEQHALRLLWDIEANRPTGTAQRWREKLRFVFVDEYQDINAAQDKIIEALSREGPRANRFLVGDLKQSIYRFRLANPGIFQSYVDEWSGARGTVIALSENFRSREALLEFINSVFTGVMRRELGGVSYDEKASLRFGVAEERRPLSIAASGAHCVELHLGVNGAGDFESADGEAAETLAEIRELQEAEKEARRVALRLRELRAARHAVWDDEAHQFRPVEWRDMAILLRAPARKAEAYAKEFSRLEIPLQVARGGFYRSLEISDLLSLLQLLDNPLQDLPVLAVLHSPLVGLTLDELAAVRRTALKTRFWTALVRWHEINGAGAVVQSPKSTVHSPQSIVQSPEFKVHNPSLVEKVGRFLERFRRWRQLARQVSLSRCLEAVLTETRYADWLLTQPRGEQRQANVRRLLSLTEKFDQFQRQGLFRFLRFIEAQQLAETEPEVAAAGEENAVRLMSIHQSKGLEFPVVVVADLAKPFNLADLYADVILDEEYGLCPQIKPPHTGNRYPSLPYWLARLRQKRELLGEELRLLYVAMTRARDTLLLSASISQGKLRTVWQARDETTTEAVLAAGSYADWLGLWFSQQTGGVAEGATRGKTATFRWTIHDESGLVMPRDNAEAAAGSESLEPVAEGAVWQALEQRLAWQYPFDAATRQPAKTSVSVLRRQAVNSADEELAVVFGTKSQVSGFESQVSSLESQVSSRKSQVPSPKWSVEGTRFRESRSRPRMQKGAGQLSGEAAAVDVGNAHHAFLENVAIEKTGTVAQLEAEAQRLCGQGPLSLEEAALLDFDGLAAFWSSDLGERIRSQARFVQRELAFTARFSLEELARLTGRPAEAHLEGEFVVVQGVVDLAVILPDEIWVVDFKTDDVRPEEVSAKAKQYEPQLRLYGQALARIYQRPVSERWLYFLAAREARPIANSR